MYSPYKKSGYAGSDLSESFRTGTGQCISFWFCVGTVHQASGRLDTAKLSLSLFLQGEEDAAKTARELVELNQQRKDMTADGVEEAKRVWRNITCRIKCLSFICHRCTKSCRNHCRAYPGAYHKPVFVLTKAEEGVKGSGRSIEEYSMYEELCKCRELLEKFGGHPMAAGLSLRKKTWISSVKKSMPVQISRRMT